MPAARQLLPHLLNGFVKSTSEPPCVCVNMQLQQGQKQQQESETGPLSAADAKQSGWFGRSGGGDSLQQVGNAHVRFHSQTHRISVVCVLALAEIWALAPRACMSMHGLGHPTSCMVCTFMKPHRSAAAGGG